MISLEVQETHYYDKELKAILVFAKQHNHYVKYSEMTKRVFSRLESIVLVFDMKIFFKLYLLLM